MHGSNNRSVNRLVDQDAYIKHPVKEIYKQSKIKKGIKKINNPKMMVMTPVNNVKVSQ